MKTPQIAPLAGMTPLGVKPQSDKFSVTSNCDDIGLVLGEIALVKNGSYIAVFGNHLNAKKDAAKLVSQLNEHAALNAVAEAGRTAVQYLREEIGKNGVATSLCAAIDNIETKLANLAAARGVQPEPIETAYRKAIRTGVKPSIWPPIVMTREDLEHFRKSTRSGKEAL